MNKKQKNLLYRIIAAAVMMILLYLLPLQDKPVLRFVLFLVPYLIVGYDILRKAWKGILNRQVFDENFLMAVATVGAMALGEYSESVAVMLFYQIGELFQSYAVGKSRRSITELMDIRPDYANIETEDGVERTDPDEVEIGTIIVVQPGEKVPIDGIVEEGESSINTSALTGESVPQTVRPGDEILSGSINQSGLLRIRTTKEFDESTASKILELVENASSRKARSEQFITKFARVYTPAVCIGALALAVIGPLGSAFLAGKEMSGALWSDWIYRALTFLVISCPCAIVVSIPLSFFGGLGGAGSRGILIKGSNFMETLANVGCVVMDKTGTITKGTFEVTEIHHSLLDKAELLRYAALAEMHSSHPIAGSLRRAYEKALREAVREEACEEAFREESGEETAAASGLHLSGVTDVEELSGQGVIAEVDGHKVAVGNLRLMKTVGAECEPCHKNGTIVYIAVDGKPQGHVVITDEIKPSSAEAVRQLKAAGVGRIVMLTGDRRGAAEEIAGQAGITEIHADLMPEDKVRIVEELLEEMHGSRGGASSQSGEHGKSGENAGRRSGRGSKLAFVGDGINDAPVLSRADLGIAMGALGSDAAIEAADVVLMDDDPVNIAKAIRIARKCIRIVYENIWFAIGVKLICLLLGALGIANMWIAIFADVGVMVICVLNAIRALMVQRI